MTPTVNYSLQELRDMLRSDAPLSGIGDINTLALAIQSVEGYYPGSAAYRNNNPGNLMYVGQSGATGADSSGFAIFPSYQAGYQALLNQITLDASRGETIAQFTAKYAPASAGNDPTSYANTLATAAGLSPSDLLSAALDGSSIDASLTDFSSSSSALDDFSASLGIPTPVLIGVGLGVVGLLVYALSE
jgi:hypothetical protein